VAALTKILVRSELRVVRTRRDIFDGAIHHQIKT
jgi:hypothetical protein